MKQNILIMTSTILVALSVTKDAHVSTFELPDVNIESAFSHQRELVGAKRAPQTLISTTTIARQIASKLVFEIVSENLPKKYKKDAKRVTAAIVQEANKYNMDPLFLVSVIKQESSFRPDAIGSVGEIGLMQIRPTTAEWLNKEFKIVKKVNLQDPVVNIRIGAFYFNKLRNKFDQNSRWYISAYNMGATKLKRKIAENVKPKEYVQNVMRHYVKYMDMLQVAFEQAQNEIEISQKPVSTVALLN